MVETISEELREKILPHLKEMLDEDSWEYIPDIFDEGGVFTYPNGVPLVTLHLAEDYPAPQFLVSTGEFVELTQWDYIQTVDAEAQLAEEQQKELIQETIVALEHYLKTEYKTITDFEKIVANREEITVNNETIYQYNCPGQTIYLDATNYPITYEKQVVIDDTYYYNFSENLDYDNNEVDLLTYSVPYEWKRTTNIWE